MTRPIIGITVDNRDNAAQSGKYESSLAYTTAVAAVGGLPVLLPHEPELAGEYIRWCDGLLFTGGVDPDTTLFDSDEPIHPQARAMDPRRQHFEMAMLSEISNFKSPRSNHSPPACLGVCLGMQLMALHHGGRLNQYLPDTHATTAMHEKNRPHALVVEAEDGWLNHASVEERTVISSHRQAVADPGRMRVLARATDGVIEAIDWPGAEAEDNAFYVGVQWHPERGGDGPLSLGLIRRFVQSASRSASPGTRSAPASTPRRPSARRRQD